MDYNIDAKDAFVEIFGNTPWEVWEMLDSGVRPRVQEGVVVLDVRSRIDYDNFHIPCALSLENGMDFGEYEKVFVICNRGNSSKEYVQRLIDEGVNAYSINGGMAEWSRLDYPRWRPVD